MSNIFKTSLPLLLVSSALTAGSAFAQDAPPQDEVVTTGVFIPNEKRITSEITSVLDEEIFDTMGASDIAGALTRVTGISLSQGKFVIVRGLNERYSSATLNGSPLPSPEPLRRVAPLDLFPTSVLSDVVVQKTFSPEYSGEFGGGAIQMSTKGLPDEAFLDLSISGSLNTETFRKSGLVYGGSDSDWLGFDDGLRDLPALDASGVPVGNFENFQTLIIDKLDRMPGDIGARITAGNRMDLDSGASIGVLGTIGYSNSWETRRGSNNNAIIDAGQIRILDDFTRTSTENEIALNGMLTAGLELNENHTFQAIGLMTRQSSAEARTNEGFQGQEGRFLRQDFTEWFEREVYMGQLLGEHYFPKFNDAELNWRASYAQAGRDAPYERRVNYEDFQNGLGYQFQFNRLGTANDIKFSELDDESTDFGVDFVLPFDFGARPAELKLGGAYLDKTRDTAQANFRYVGSLPAPLRESRIDTIFSDDVIAAGILQIDRQGTTGFPDLSTAGLETMAAYAGLDLEYNEFFRLAFGLRYEESEQTTVTARSGVANSAFAFDPLKEDYLLPSATATFTFADNWQVRLAASQTINRPQFRELTPSIFVNTETDERFVGNPFLTNSKSTNFDARIEYYFASNQFVTVGAFYKDLTDPIEEFTLPLGAEVVNSFVNAPSAELFGLEVEFEKKFNLADMGLKGRFWDSKDFIVRSNYTFADSTVSADGNVLIVTPPAGNSTVFTPVGGADGISAAGIYVDGRKLQGQSDHLANLQIGIEDYDKGYEATLLLNYSSERIRSVGGSAGRIIPDIIEQLPVSLDFVFNYDFELRGGAYELGLKVQNILGDQYEATQSFEGDTVTIDDYEIGTTFAASLKRRF